LSSNPDESTFITVGKVKDAHGLKGELYITLFAKEAAWLPSLKTIQLKVSETAQSTNFSVKNARLHKGGLIVMTHEIRDRNEAEALKGSLFEIPSEFLVSKKGESIYLKEIEGFSVQIEGQSELATIVGFGSNGAQDLLLLKMPHGEFEVPFVEAFVKEINYSQQKLHLNLPPGLLGEFENEGES
jgi:16S rRNA processing protein RimM